MILNLLHAIIIWSFHFYKVKCTGSDVSIEQKIHDDILVGYSKFIRPVRNLNDTITVRLHTGLYCLIYVDTAAQQVTLKHWYRMYWKDAFLTWDPAKYDGISEIKLSMDEIWLPDIMLLSLTDMHQLGNEYYVVTLESDGNVLYSVDQKLTVYNTFDVTNFPFDTQNISLVYSSWNYQANQIDMDITLPTDIVNYIENNEWTLLNYTTMRSGYTTSIGRKFVSVYYNIIIQRKPSYYISTFVWPSFIITCLSIIGVFSPFNETGERQERVTLGLTTLLTMAVVLMIITGQTPKSSNGMPLLGIFVMAEIVVSATVSIIATIIIYLHSSWLKNDPVPNFLLILTCLPTTRTNYFDASATTPLAKSDSDRRTSTSDQSNAQYKREKMRREKLQWEWSTVTKRLDTILLFIFLIINSIVVAVFILIGNSK